YVIYACVVLYGSLPQVGWIQDILSRSVPGRAFAPDSSLHFSEGCSRGRSAFVQPALGRKGNLCGMEELRRTRAATAFSKRGGNSLIRSGAIERQRKIAQRLHPAHPGPARR